MNSAATTRALAAATFALVAFVAVAVGVRARRNRASWWGRAERVCSCGDATRRALGRLSQEAVGGLAEAAAAQRALLQSDCDDLRVAVSRRSWGDELARRPLRVVATDQHYARAEAVTRSLATMCAGVNEEFWERLTLDLAAHEGDPAEEPSSRVRAIARGHLAIRTGMCRDRARLTTAPRSYALTAIDADRQASECAREISRVSR